MSFAPILIGIYAYFIPIRMLSERILQIFSRKDPNVAETFQKISKCLETFSKIENVELSNFVRIFKIWRIFLKPVTLASGDSRGRSTLLYLIYPGYPTAVEYLVAVYGADEDELRGNKKPGPY